MNPSNRFGDMLDRSREEEPRTCWFCNKTEEDIKKEYYKYLLKQDPQFSDVSFDELIVMTGKLQKPVCAACYFNIRESSELIEEIYNKPEDEVW